MRPLTEEETKTLFTKLSHYVGPNIVHLVDRKDEPHVFRLHRDRVYYVSEVRFFFFSLCVPSLPHSSLPYLYRRMKRADPMQLTFKEMHEDGNLHRAAQPRVPGDVLWQVQQDGQVQAARHRPRCVGTVCKVQGPSTFTPRLLFSCIVPKPG